MSEKKILCEAMKATVGNREDFHAFLQQLLGGLWLAYRIESITRCPEFDQCGVQCYWAKFEGDNPERCLIPLWGTKVCFPLNIVHSTQAAVQVARKCQRRVIN